MEDTYGKATGLQRVMRFRTGEFPEEYDAASGKWKTNKELSKIYDGSIDCDPITEEEVNAIIASRTRKRDL